MMKTLIAIALALSASTAMAQDEATERRKLLNTHYAAGILDGYTRACVLAAVLEVRRRAAELDAELDIALANDVADLCVDMAVEYVDKGVTGTSVYLDVLVLRVPIMRDLATKLVTTLISRP